MSAHVVVGLRVCRCEPKSSGFVKLILDGIHTEECIKVTSFTNDRKEKVYIGMTEDVQQFLGLPIKSFEDFYIAIEQMQIKVDALDLYLKVAEQIIQQYRKASFKHRLKYLFTGRLPTDLVPLNELVLRELQK